MLAQISNLYLLTRRTPQTPIKWCEHAILWEFEVFEDCGNCIAMEQSGYISEWQNLLLTLTSYNLSTLLFFEYEAVLLSRKYGNIPHDARGVS